ncbi:MAG: vWA domain-containing protein [Candidatus Woesearchaeota archaeon]
MDGKLESNPEDEKLARSVIEDDNAKADGNLIQEGVNQGLGAFVPETLFSNIVKNYKQAKQLYGEKILSEVTGYSPDYVEKNAKIPEFQKELESNIGERIKRLQKNNYISKDGIIQEKGYKLSSLVMYTQELDQLEAKGLLGEKENKEKAHYGQRKDSDFYKKGDRYADIDVMKTLKVAIRRGHTKIQAGDLKIFERESKGNLEIIYAIDASGSMKGKKIEMSKKAGIALAYKAIENKDRVGLLAFGDRIKAKVQPTTDFTEFLEKTARIQANNETNFPEAIEESIRTFSQDNNMKHLIFITDGMPTAGEDPEKEALEAISKAVSANITVSMIGIEVQEDSAKFLREAAEIGKGKFHNVANVEELDVIILQDYDSQ